MDLITQLPAPDRDTRLALNKNFVAIQLEDTSDDARVSREIQDRKNADNHLQEQIDSLRQRLDTAESNISNLQTRMSTAEEQIKKLNEVIFGTEYINDTDEVALDDSMTPEPDVEVNETNVVDNNQAEIDTSRDGYVTANEEIN